MAEVLVVSDVTVRYEHHAPPVLEGLSFRLREGERVALVGLNGTGKTTLLMALVGLAPHDGEIWVSGVRVTRETLAQVRDSVGFLFNVPEDQFLFPKVVEDVAFGLIRKGCAADEAFERARKALDALGVGPLADLALHHLSHGQKQRVALAGAIVTTPPLLLFDEPTACLDPPGRKDLAAVLRDRDASQLIATHDLDFAYAACTRILVLENGRIAGDYPDTAAVRAAWFGGGGGAPGDAR